MERNNPLPFKLSNKAVKQLRNIRKLDRKLFDKINSSIKIIQFNSSIGELKKGDLKGFRSLDFTHLGTNYELCYTVEANVNSDEIILIIF